MVTPQPGFIINTAARIAATFDGIRDRSRVVRHGFEKARVGHQVEKAGLNPLVQDSLELLNSGLLNDKGDIATNHSLSDIQDALTNVSLELTTATKGGRLNKKAGLLQDAKAIENIFDLANRSNHPELKAAAAAVVEKLLVVSSTKHKSWLPESWQNNFNYTKDALIAQNPRDRFVALHKFLVSVQEEGGSLQDALNVCLGHIDKSYEGHVGEVYRKQFSKNFSQLLTHPGSIVDISDDAKAKTASFLGVPVASLDEIAPIIKDINTTLGQIFVESVDPKYQASKLVTLSRDLIAGYQTRTGEESQSLIAAREAINEELKSRFDAIIHHSTNITKLSEFNQDILEISQGKHADKEKFVSAEIAELIKDQTPSTAIQINGNTPSPRLDASGKVIGYNISVDQAFLTRVESTLTNIKIQKQKEATFLAKESKAIRDAFEKLAIRDKDGKLSPGIEGLYFQRLGTKDFFDKLCNINEVDNLAELVKVNLDARKTGIKATGAAAFDLPNLIADFIADHISQIDTNIACTQAELDKVQQRRTAAEAPGGIWHQASQLVSNDTFIDPAAAAGVKTRTQKLQELSDLITSLRDANPTIVNKTAEESAKRLDRRVQDIKAIETLKTSMGTINTTDLADISKREAELAKITDADLRQRIQSLTYSDMPAAVSLINNIKAIDINALVTPNSRAAELAKITDAALQSKLERRLATFDGDILDLQTSLVGAIGIVNSDKKSAGYPAIAATTNPALTGLLARDHDELIRFSENHTSILSQERELKLTLEQHKEAKLKFDTDRDGYIEQLTEPTLADGSTNPLRDSIEHHVNGYREVLGIFLNSTQYNQESKAALIQQLADFSVQYTPKDHTSGFGDIILVMIDRLIKTLSEYMGGSRDGSGSLPVLTRTQIANN